EDDEQAAERPAVPVPPAHGGVARVLALAEVAPGQVAREAQTPEGGEGHHQDGARRRGGAGGQRGAGREDEAEAPEGADDAAVPEAGAAEPEPRHGSGDRQRGEGVRGEPGHRARGYGTLQAIWQTFCSAWHWSEQRPWSSLHFWVHAW